MTSDALRALLRDAKTIAVVGLSPKPWRASHQVADYLQRAGYRIVPVNPGHATLLGEKSYPGRSTPSTWWTCFGAATWSGPSWTRRSRSSRA
jgi:hypothetical protein